MLPSQRQREIVLLDESQLDEREAEAIPAGTGLGQSAIELLPRDQAVAEQDIAYTFRGRGYCHLSRF